MGHRINERNTGGHNLEGGAKRRRTAKAKLSEQEIELAKAVLMRVYEAMEYDGTLGKYVDNGNIILSLDKKQWELLYDIANERKF